MHKVKFLILLLILSNSSFANSRTNYVIMGPPGAGKGSFSQFMKKKYNYVPICVGDRLKEHVRNKTKIGLQIKAIIERGDFVDTAIGNNILREDLRSCLKSGKNFIIDGFIRNNEYFNYLDEILKEFDATENVVFLVFSHNEEVSLKRIMDRIICNECGEIYNTETKKPSSMRWGQCGHELDIRFDDKDKSIVKRRFKRYITDSLPTVKEIELKYKVIRIDSTKKWDELEEIYQTLEQK